MIARYSATLMVLYITTAMLGLGSSAAAQGSATDIGEWVLPRYGALVGSPSPDP